VFRDAFRSFVLIVEKFLCGNMLRFYCADPADGIVLRVRHADRQGIVASEILDGLKVAMMTYRAYMDEEVIQASRFEDGVKRASFCNVTPLWSG
jgi:hypothetical protein